ncbi:MAG: hypothetical protein HZA50_11880 [Planctomycetes bacterium]|nr:hypothetical protein [Planctomycetota bacterium]
MDRSNIESQLVEYLRKAGRDFILLSKLKQSLQKAISNKDAVAQIEKNNRLSIIKKGKSTYLAFRQPPEVFVFTAIQKKPGQSPGQIAKSTPLKIPDFIGAINVLIARGDVRCEINSKSSKYDIKLHPSKPSGSGSEAREDRDLFAKAVRELDRGQIYIRIHAVRDRLGWTRERFDRMIETLRDEGVIQLHAGDITTMSKEEVEKSFVDENNFFFATLTWRKP